MNKKLLQIIFFASILCVGSGIQAFNVPMKQGWYACIHASNVPACHTNCKIECHNKHKNTLHRSNIDSLLCPSSVHHCFCLCHHAG